MNRQQDETSLPQPRPHLGPIVREPQQRERFEGSELATVLSHYDLGVIHRIRTYPRGSRRAPKVRIDADHGSFLLKRRSPGQSDPARVAFAHEVQRYLSDHGYPLPRLIGTRDDNSTLLRLHDYTYELFEFVEGKRFDQSLTLTVPAGEALGLMHRHLQDFSPQAEPPRGSYHNADLSGHFERLPDSIVLADPDVDRDAVAATTEQLSEAYQQCAAKVEQCGYSSFPESIVHGDWHPGNILYRDEKVAAVLDFDSARQEPAMAEIANAALQFSLRMSEPEDPLSWPEGVSGRRIRGLVNGYQHSASRDLSPNERNSLPWLILEALIVESVVPIAATGRFGRISGWAFLQMVHQKTRWLVPRAETLIRYIEE